MPRAAAPRKTVSRVCTSAGRFPTWRRMFSGIHCRPMTQRIPHNILRAVGKREALVHTRDTVLRGAAVRGK